MTHVMGADGDKCVDVKPLLGRIDAAAESLLRKYASHPMVGHGQAHRFCAARHGDMANERARGGRPDDDSSGPMITLREPTDPRYNLELIPMSSTQAASHMGVERDVMMQWVHNLKTNPPTAEWAPAPSIWTFLQRQWRTDVLVCQTFCPFTPAE